MNKTVILSPYDKYISGTMERFFSKDKLTLNCVINHPCYEDGHILRLYALSTSYAGDKPFLVGYYEFTGKSTRVEAGINFSECSEKSVRHSDTYLVTKYDGQNEIPLAAAFYGLEWNVPRALKTTPKIFGSSINNEELSEDMTICNAEKTLNSLKDKKIVDKSIVKKYISDFLNSIDAYTTFDLLDNTDFVWKKITGPVCAKGLSSLFHILSNRPAVSAIEKAGFYLIGIKKDDPHHIAVAIPCDKGFCPMPDLSDCCFYDNGFHIVGVHLADDGQYFEKHLQNDK